MEGRFDRRGQAPITVTERVVARILIKGASIVTMDDRLGDFAVADLLVEGARIAAIRPNLVASDAELVDGTGRIVIPGLVNAHMHTWQTALRGVAANWTLLEYFRWVHAGLATCFRPDDIHIATLVGALNQINCGTTTLVDWCHNNPTPAHTDAAVAALFESGIRAAFFHGSPKPDPKPGEPHFSEIPHPRREVERLLKGPFASRDGLITLGLAILGPHYSTLDVSLHDFRLAKEFGLVASMHQGGGPAKTPGGWRKLIDAGLVGRGVNIVHGNDLADEDLRRLVDLGVSFSATPENEMTQGHGFPITGRLLRLGRAPSLGVDLESVLSGDMPTVARIALGMQRALDNAESRRDAGKIPDTTTVTTREALRWITVEGAAMLGLEDRIGSLAPGKQADLVMLRADDLNLWPVHDPVSTVVMQASLANVEAVMIAGEWKKRDGRLLVPGLAAKKAALAASGRRIVRELGLVSAA
jgi:cytosine/adenosine deaminase-related metal-dependent hydrolase